MLETTRCLCLLLQRWNVGDARRCENRPKPPQFNAEESGETPPQSKESAETPPQSKAARISRNAPAVQGRKNQPKRASSLRVPLGAAVRRGVRADGEARRARRVGQRSGRAAVGQEQEHVAARDDQPRRARPAQLQQLVEQEIERRGLRRSSRIRLAAATSPRRQIAPRGTSRASRAAAATTPCRRRTATATAGCRRRCAPRRRACRRATRRRRRRRGARPRPPTR